MTIITCQIMIACIFPLDPPPPINEKPVLISWYDPAIGGINCDSDCTVFADMTPVTDEAYGQVAACPVEWIGKRITIPQVGDYLCRDTGGAIRVTYDDGRGWHIPIDILAKEQPDMFGYLISGWSLN
jgi:hypothetical protein